MDVLLKTDGKSSRRILPAVAAVLVACILFAGAAILYCFDPTKYHFYPQCPIYRFTGILCPGCGSTRAAYMLLHGNVSQSLKYNLMLLPTLCCLTSIVIGKSQKVYWVTAVWLASLTAYTILRNLNYQPLL